MNRNTTNKAGLVPFMLCVRFLQGLGKCFGLSYERISVVFNLYLQGGILTLSAALPLVATVLTIGSYPVVGTLLLVLGCGSYLSIYVVGLIGMLRRYHRPMEYAFERCAKDLVWLAGKWNTTYYAVNLVIFVVWWLTLVGMNLFAAYSILKQQF